VIAFFHNCAILKHDDSRRHPDRGKPVRDEKSHFALRQLIESLEDFVLGAGIESGRRLVENQDLRLSKIGPSESKLLPFAA
jgi:hypothetical protein